MKSIQDILNAIWDKFDYYQNLDSVDMEGTKDINDFLLNALTEFEREITERIKGLQFVYEHQWFGSDDLRVCEKCGEQIKKSSPCKASPHYMCWQGLNELLVQLEKEKRTQYMECKKCLEIHKRDSNQKIQCPFCNEIIGCFWHNRGVSFKHLQTHKQKEVNNLDPNPTKGEEQR